MAHRVGVTQNISPLRGNEARSYLRFAANAGDGKWRLYVSNISRSSFFCVKRFTEIISHNTTVNESVTIRAKRLNDIFSDTATRRRTWLVAENFIQNVLDTMWFYVDLVLDDTLSINMKIKFRYFFFFKIANHLRKSFQICTSNFHEKNKNFKQSVDCTCADIRNI